MSFFMGGLVIFLALIGRTKLLNITLAVTALIQLAPIYAYYTFLAHRIIPAYGLPHIIQFVVASGCMLALTKNNDELQKRL
jgi:hypothetical protein